MYLLSKSLTIRSYLVFFYSHVYKHYYKQICDQMSKRVPITQITDSLKELIKDDNIIIVYKISFNKIT
jgi:hypothetical protein